MSETKCCCNCIHCARWRRKSGIETHCDLTDEYLGYLKVMDEDNDCKHWEKETKWDLDEEHDKQIRAEARADTLDEVISKMISLHEEIVLRYGIVTPRTRADAFDELKNWLKEQTNDM